MSDFTAICKLYGITEPRGFSDVDIKIGRNVFGKLPFVLEAYYKMLGKCPFNQAQDSLITPVELDSFKNKDYLVFYIENQGVCVWGIRQEDLAQDDPPVYVSYDRLLWNKEADTLTDFLTAMAYLQGIFALDYGPKEFRWVTYDEIKLIAANYAKKTVCFTQWLEGVEFYGNQDDEIIAVMSDATDNTRQLIYSSGSEEHFEAMHSFLGQLGEPL